MKPDYKKILDPEIWKFIQNTESFYSETEEKDMSITEIRSAYNEMCKFFSISKPAEVKSEDKFIQSIPIRVYHKFSNLNKKVSIIYFHGGGFILGGLDSHDSFCSEICAATSLELFSVDYKLAPEFTPYIALKECMEFIKWYESNIKTPYILLGDSAGGWIAANITHQMRHGLKFLLGQLLIYPALGGDMSKGSYIYHANAPLLTTEWIVSNRRKFFKNNNLIENKFFPLKTNDFKKIPPTVVFSAECDPLSDDGKIYTQKLKFNNNNAKFFLEKGLVHSYIRAINVSKKANASFQKIVKELNHLAEGDWPHDVLV